MKEHISGHENPHLERAQAIGEAHFQIATDMTRADGSFDYSTGEVIMRVPAVFADRLTPFAFSRLSESLQQGFGNLASMANVIKPMSESELQPRPQESESAHRYRTTVYQPIHNLQQALLEKGYGDDIEPIVRESVFMASSLFKQGVVETVGQNNSAIIETLNYFEDKTAQAIRWSQRSKK